MFDFALESLQGQAKSKLGTELDKLWQKVIDYRDVELHNDYDVKVRFRKIQKFFDKEIAQRFMDVVWKYAGLYIDKIEYTNSYDGQFCNWSFIGSKEEGNIQGYIDNVVSGRIHERLHGYDFGNPDPELLLKIASSYDTANCCIKQQDKEEIAKYVGCAIGFDVFTGFLAEDILPRNSGFVNLTAQELSAIMLHEIGHTLILVENATKMYAQIETFKYLSGAYTAANSANPSAVANLATKTAEKLDAKGHKQLAKKLRDTTQQFKGDIVQAGNSVDIPTERKLILGLIDTIFTLIGDAFTFTYDFIFGSDASLRISGADQKMKYGDLPLNIRWMNWNERNADKYAFNHGYGAELTSGLTKFGQLWERLGKTKAQCAKITAAEKACKDISFLDKMRLMLYAPGLCSTNEHYLYPEGSKRFREMLKITIQQLKDNGTDPSTVQKYMKDIEIILDNIKHYDKRRDFAFRMAHGYAILMDYISIPSFIDMLVHGKVRRELDNLINDLETLQSNSIYYYGVKLQQLAKKDK